MKNLFVITALLLVPSLASAQSVFKPGTISIGGEISFSKTSYTYESGGMEIEQEQTVIRFAPLVGYFVTPNIQAFGQLEYADYEDSHSMFGLTVGANYFHPLMPKLYAYAGGAVFLNSLSYEDNTDVTIYGLMIQAGVLYMFNEHIGLNAALKFKIAMGSAEYDGGGEADVSGTELGLGYFGIMGFFNL
ncbi:hypothetical protein KKF34_17445 [Myxococcota bacterium]|nr:hypothetical protein [Myxococcota bacterium]MBU1382470.1 hypothetical protein [Myxococcota bacterium]MBU1498667.1 hypothetical protein [Myxococcota bacterium]